MRVLACVLMTTLAACGGVEANFRGGDAVNGDAYVSLTGCDGGAARLIVFKDGDGDGHGDPNATTSNRCPEDAMPPGFASTSDDCNDANVAVYNTCGTNPPPGGNGNKPVDEDGDNWWTIQSGAPDCNDQDKEVNPGLPEACGPSGNGDGKDNDCDGTVDEGCNGTPPVSPAPTGAKVKVTASYQNSLGRALRASTVEDTNYMGPYWDGLDVPFTTTGIKELGLKKEASGATIAPCGALVQVDDGPGHWLCYGHNATAVLDPLATTLVQHDGQNYTMAQCITYSPPGGNEKGCAMWCSFHNPAARCHGM